MEWGLMIFRYFKERWYFDISKNFKFELRANPYLQPRSLSAADAKEYYNDNPQAPAAPMMWLCFGALWHLIATTVEYVYTYVHSNSKLERTFLTSNFLIFF